MGAGRIALNSEQIMKSIGVIGAGQMGAGIAQVSAQAGYHVLLSDIDQARAQAGKDGIAKGLNRLVEKEKITGAARDAALALIEPVAGSSAFAQADLVIEAATEREEIKRAIFAEVGKVIRADAILASNTSSIPITRLAQAAPDPARFIGVHFFNPVPVMGLIELIRGLATSVETVEAVEAFGQSLGKAIVHANDAPGFIVNRILMPMLNEACFALGEGVATVQDIDTAWLILLGLIPVLRFAACSTAARVIPSSAPRPCSSNMSKRAGWVARLSGGFMIIRGRSLCRRDKSKSPDEF
jgi:3-hydroxybutyryl-CoA dehydrogenase